MKILLAAARAGGMGPGGRLGLWARATVAGRDTRQTTERRTKPMALNEIPPFPIHSSEMTVLARRKLLSQHEFAVIVFAASGISAHSRRVARATMTAAVEWSKKGKKTIVHQDCCNSKLR